MFSDPLIYTDKAGSGACNIPRSLHSACKKGRCRQNKGMAIAVKYVTLE